jgi:hypothetical protein
MTTRLTLPAFLLLLLAMLVIVQFIPQEPHRFPPMTDAERKAITKALRHHGYFSAVTTASGTFIRAKDGLIWIERK